MRAAGAIVLMAAAGTNILAQGLDDPTKDSQFWPDTQANIRIANNLNLVLYGTIRLGRDDKAVVNEQIGIGLNRTWGRYLSGAVQYRYINSEPTPDRQSRENRLHFDLSTRLSLIHKFVITDRNRFEIRRINAAGSWRYRNRVQLERSMAVRNFKITPYISVEPFYDSRFEEWNRTQLYTGARIPVVRHVTFDGFYMRQWDPRVKPGFLHVFGAFWRLEF